MKTSIKMLFVALICVCTSGAIMAQVCGPADPPLCVPGNGFAFQFAGDIDHGLKFNTGTTDFEFTNASANAVIGFDAFTGNISIPGGGALQVGPNRYAFQFTLTPNYGLFFNAAGFAYEFRTADASPVFSIGANSGNLNADGTITAGGNINAPSGNLNTGGNVNANAGNVNTVDVNASGSVTGTDGASQSYAVKGLGINGPTNGYLGVQGTTDFDGETELDIFGEEIGVLGVSTGASSTDNIGVLGFSDDVSIEARHETNGNVVQLATSARALTVTGQSQFSDTIDFNGNLATFQGDVFVDDRTVIVENINANINVGGSRASLANVIGDDPTPTITFATGDEDLWIQGDLEVLGQGYKTGGGLWAIVSDARLKKDVSPFEDGLETLMQIEPVKYKYNNVLEVDDKEYVGIIAQQVQEVAPYMVEEKKFFREVMENQDGSETVVNEGTDYLTYDGSALLYILVNAVQEQQSVIEAQNEKIASIDDLKDEIAQLKQDLSSCCVGMKTGQSTNHQIKKSPIESWLGQNIPNPFDRSTTIQYYTPESVGISEIRVYDMKGQEIKSYILEKGYGEVRFSEADLSAGTYVYTLINDGNAVATKKMVLQ